MLPRSAVLVLLLVLISLVGGQDASVARYEWSASFTFFGEATLNDMIEIDNRICVVGEFKGYIPLVMTTVVTTSTSAFVACFDRSNGSLLWAQAPFVDQAAISVRSSFSRLSAWAENGAVLVAGTWLLNDSHHEAVLMSFNLSSGAKLGQLRHICTRCTDLRVTGVVVAAGRVLLGGSFSGTLAEQCKSGKDTLSAFTILGNVTDLDNSVKNISCVAAPSQVDAVTATGDTFVLAGRVNGDSTFVSAAAPASPAPTAATAANWQFFVTALNATASQLWAHRETADGVPSDEDVVHAVCANETVFVVWPLAKPRLDEFTILSGAQSSRWQPVPLPADVRVQRVCLMRGDVLLLAELQAVAQVGPLQVRTDARGFIARVASGGSTIASVLTLPTLPDARRGPQVAAAGAAHVLLAGTYRWRNRTDPSPQLTLSALAPAPLWPQDSTTAPPSTTTATATATTASGTATTPAASTTSTAPPTSSAAAGTTTAPPTTTADTTSAGSTTAPPTTTATDTASAGATTTAQPTSTDTTSATTTAPTATTKKPRATTSQPEFDTPDSGSSFTLLLIYAAVILGVGTLIWYAWKKCSTAPGYSNSLQQTESDL